MLSVLLFYPLAVCADFEWVTYTLDNDLFLSDDSGYTNGLSVAFYNVSGKEGLPSPGWMLKPIDWLLTASNKPDAAVNIITIGQAMLTPEDISVAVPSEGELPYAGLLSISNTYLTLRKKYANKISVTYGFVGPLSFAEETQKVIHTITGSDDPKGWDTQLKNEFVFQFGIGRAWRNWESNNREWDLINTVEMDIGTIASRIDTGVMLRFGSNLIRSYATPLLSSSRTTNPAAIGGDWNVYAGLNAGYIFNQIFADGNTFRDSRSIDYDREKIRATIGFTISWQEYSIAFAIVDADIIKNNSTESQGNLTRYGTLTLAVKLD